MSSSPDQRPSPEAGRGAATGGTFPLGRILGVPMRAHWSVLIIMGLIAADVAAQALPAGSSGEAAWQSWTVGLVAAVAFLLGLLAHEAAHAVVARRNGVGVQDITLWMLGGTTRLTGGARTPGAEARIAGAGPLTSLLLGVGCFGLAWGLAALGVPGLAVGTVRWLGAINVLLALFNVLPGAPLDGGRLVLAGLWKWRGDRLWAAIAAARAGLGLGALLILLGALEFILGGDDVSGLWLALVGWFLLGAARGEERQARLWSRLEGVPVRAVMTPDPDVLSPATTVAELIARDLLTPDRSALPLTEEGRPVGLVTLRQARALPLEVRTTTTLGAIATPLSELPLASPDEDALELIPRLDPATDAPALVVEDGRLVGIVSAADVARAAQHAPSRRPGVPNGRD